MKLTAIIDGAIDREFTVDVDWRKTGCLAEVAYLLHLLAWKMNQVHILVAARMFHDILGAYIRLLPANKIIVADGKAVLAAEHDTYDPPAGVKVIDNGNGLFIVKCNGYEFLIEAVHVRVKDVMFVGVPIVVEKDTRMRDRIIREREHGIEEQMENDEGWEDLI